MADKFPEIDTVQDSTAMEESDFLAREKQALGDEFASAGDSEIMKEVNSEDEDGEFEEFKSQFPEVGEPVAAIAEAPSGASVEDDQEDDGEVKATVNQFTNLNLDESEHVQEWRKTRDLEIAKRDEIAQRKLAELKEEAEKSIDDFYENYNNKKDDAIAETKKAESEFLEKRDRFLEKGTVWDRAVQLLKLDKNSDAIDADNHRDKTKFRDLLLALKGKEGVPGAAA